MKRTPIFVLLIGLLSCGLNQAQEASPPRTASETSPELEAIRAESQAFVSAFNQGDAETLAALWTEDGEYVDDAGQELIGRDAIQKAYAQYFADNPGVTLRLTIDSLRLVGPGVAIEDGRALQEPAPAREPGVSAYTVMHVKADGKWRMASVRDRWIPTPTEVASAADLDWLVGTWIAEEHGVRTESVIRWVIDDRFLSRTYTTTHVDGSRTSGVQLIGWNALDQHVQSWDFSPDGGHAVGHWTPIEGGWIAEMQGISGDGHPTAAVNLLVRLDDDAYAWQSTQRFRGDVALPDTTEVIIKRRAQP